jgi:hypothetical protein
MGNDELTKAVYKLIEEIAAREKNKSVSVGDYGTALVATIIEGIFAQAASGFN